MSKWEETRLGELIEINPETLFVSKYTGEIKYIDIASVNTGSLEGYTTYEISDAPSRARRIIKDKDIIFSTVRPNLKAYYFVKNAPPNAICSTGFAVLRAKKGVNSRFVYSLVTENSFVDYLTLVAKGSAYPAVDTNDFKKAKVTVPDLHTQERIADILSTYDDLIEANNRRIKLLEQAAQELYTEWFVRFRFPGYENAKFENGLPEGWDFCRLGKIMSFGAGKTRPESGETYPVYGGNGILDYCNYYNNENAIIIGRVGAYCGTVYYEPDKCWISDNALFAESKNDASFYNYYLLKNMNLKARQVGTGQPLITQGLLNKIKILLPPEPVVKKFNEISSELLKQQHTLRKQNTNLATQRDMLLPRLMSGKLEV